MPLDPSLKQLQIKVGTVKRTKKEYSEEGVQRSKIETMKAEGKEEADVKKQMEVLNDTLTVIPDSRQRLQKYAVELRDFLADCQDVSVEPETSPEVQTILEARQILREVDLALGTQTAEEDQDMPADKGQPDVGDF
eukprot:CAMPEP_0114643828 /NCGR_PEP_ID=MMETSP0191-20121206/3620_1 /TAXON_ID=126664 /ORGANISM="Sorites sp." /LENGTH=135 /DNA_ID=CAMNT_0001856205 /DNA_START=24 /DNA_END=431 /DNA_ORIENTATION=-